MIARLILALLLVLAGTPAAAMPAGCHDGAMAGMPMAAPATPRHHPAAAIPTDHGCIGCAALADWLAERVVAPTIAAAPAPLPLPDHLDLRGQSPPTLRPPRIG